MRTQTAAHTPYGNFDEVLMNAETITQEQRENIVRAVNAHEELVRFAMILVSDIELMRDKGALLPSDSTLTAMNMVRAITKAEGK